MKDSIILEGKIYISAKRAAKIINYAQDYIGQLCRANKLECKMIGRAWFVTEESLIAHRENSIDSTEERALKIIKDNDLKTRETIKTTLESEKNAPHNLPALIPVFPILSPLQIPMISGVSLKYESEKKSLLPELNKKVPKTFNLPKNISNLDNVPFLAQKTSSVSLPSSNNTFAVTVVIVLLLLGGLLFMTSLPSFEKGKSLTQGEASIVTSVSGFFVRIMQALGFAPKTNSSFATNNSFSNDSSPSVRDLNGLGIVPSTNSSSGDAVAKAKIINSFSDEVTVHADHSGTAGIITPVFKKTNGNDFVYVLVPVKEKKQ
jgi:hypothetical protein